MDNRLAKTKRVVRESFLQMADMTGHPGRRPYTLEREREMKQKFRNK